MASEEEKEFYKEMINKGCCKRCILRYLGICKTLITFPYPDTCLINFGFIKETDECRNKIRKDNPCTVCLGLLQDDALNKMIEHENLSFVEQYEHLTFVPYITFPTCILIRDHSMKIHLKKLFPKCFDVNNVIKINHAWRYSVENKLSDKLNKTYQHTSKLTLHYYTDYILEKDEMEAVQSCVNELLSKHLVVSILESIPDETFENVVRVPPRIPLYSITVQDLKCFSESIHLKGNYCKYSRELPQTLYTFINTPAENSVETIIVKAVKSVLGDFEQQIFKASAFDDQNVRVLGSGRTFHLQLVNPKFSSVSRNQCNKIEEKIRKSQVLEVKNLREEDKRDILATIEQEKLSTKTYKVLCQVRECKNLNHSINAVNMYTTITVQQKTPLSLLNVRSGKVKTKKIFYIRATKFKDKNDLIELELCTECGFYISEFCNGDYGRTTPSLSEIMRAKVECVAIDIIDFYSTVPYLAA